MPAMDFQGSSVPFASFGRSILSIRRDQVHAVDAHDAASGGEQSDLDAFQRHVADLFGDLAASGEELLSISWVRKLLDAFVVCLEEFRVLLFNHRGLVARPPLDRMIADFFERAVKALDVCNAVRDGIDQVRRWRKHLEIVLLALDPANRVLGDGQLRRAKKTLADLTVVMIDEKDASQGSSGAPHRNRSFGRSAGGGSSSSSRGQHNARAHFRSLSCSVSRSWSAARQLQAIGNAIAAPRNHEIVATSGLAVPVYTMNSVLLFVMWSLVAAIPCQDRGLQAHISLPRSFPWAAPIMSLHERILEESKKKERRHSNGLLKEILQTDRCAHHLADLIDAVQSPVTEDKAAEMRQGVEELTRVSETMKEGLDPLERQVREVFVRIVRNRTEGFDSLSRNAD